MAHIPLIIRDCQYRWGEHGCSRVGDHTQHLCVCGRWAKNHNPDGKPARHARHDGRGRERRS